MSQVVVYAPGERAETFSLFPLSHPIPSSVLNSIDGCAADFSLLNLPKGKSLGRSKPATNSYYIQALLNCLL